MEPIREEVEARRGLILMRRWRNQSYHGSFEGRTTSERD